MDDDTVMFPTPDGFHGGRSAAEAAFATQIVDRVASYGIPMMRIAPRWRSWRRVVGEG